MFLEYKNKKSCEEILNKAQDIKFDFFQKWIWS